MWMAVDPKIQQKADKIRNEVYGKDVREALASGIEEMSKDVVDVESRQDEVETQFQTVIENTTDKDVISAPEIISARVGTDSTTHSNLKARLDAEHNEVVSQLAEKANQEDVDNNHNQVMSQLAQKAEQDDLVVERARIDSLATLSEGSTTGDAELIDARIGADGVTYDNVGGAIRGQINKINNDLAEHKLDYVDLKGVNNGAVTPAKTSFFKIGKNLFNKNTATIGYYVSNLNGELYPNATYAASDYIPVTPSTVYSFTNGNSIRFAFYDSSKVFISGLKQTVSPITTPVNCAYVRYSFYATALDIQQFELGSIQTDYKSYGYYLPFDSIDKIPDNSISANALDFTEIGKNLFNKNNITTGYYVNYLTGELAPSVAYVSSYYIPVLANTEYVRSHDYQMAFYDSNKTYISGIASGVTGSFVTPPNCAYIRTSVGINVIDEFQVEKGNIPSSYESYGYKINTSVYSEDEVIAFLPSEICVAVGRTIELYNKQVVWCGNPNNYHFKWTCSKGKTMKRKWTYTGASGDIGTYTLTLTVLNNNLEDVATATTTLNVVSNVISTPKSILCIGDSLTNEKAWLSELRTLSSNQITLIGTRGTAPLNHEGRSGFSAAQYLAATEYTFESEGIQPFWNPTSKRFDWAYYKTQTGLAPDAVQIFLGTNGIELNPNTNAGNIKQIIDYIRQDDVAIPIYLVFTLYSADQNGMGISFDTLMLKALEDRKVFNLMRKLYTLLSEYTNLYFIPVSLTHDSEYNFGVVSTKVNPRATQYENLPSQSTHPQEQGYLQMADIMFSVYAAHL